MDAAERFANAITSHSKIVILVLLVATAMIGAGAGTVDDDSSLDQFESDSPEAEAAAYIGDNFTADTDDNTTTVQLIVRGEDVLTQESILASLEYQQELRENESINATLDGDPMGVENLVATTAILEERGDELEAESEALNESADELEEDSEALNESADELEAEFEALNESADELEEDSEELEADAEALEASYQRLATDAAELEAESEALEDEQEALIEDQQELEARTEILNDSLGEAVALSMIHEDEEEYHEAVQPVRDAAVEDADLDAEQTATFDEAIALIGEADEPDDPEIGQAYAMVVDPEQGVFAEDWAELEERGEELEAWGAELEERGEELEEREEALGEHAEEIEERGEDLEEHGDELEAWGEELEEWGDDLEEQGEELEERAEELEEDAEELEEDAEQLEEEAGNITITEQIEKIESMDDEEFEEALLDTLSDDEDTFALELMPAGYDPGTTSADARMMMITQNTSAAHGANASGDEAGDELQGFDSAVLDAQQDMQTIGDEQDDEYIVFGAGVITDEIDQSMGDSLAIVGPLALLFVVLALAIAYRDPLDIVLGIAGIFVVLIWTFGFMGWIGIAFNQMFVAVPVLLIGLSIDYAIHVFMRHREQREADGVADSVRGSMSVALLGVGIALIWVTATAALGFLANLVSPIGPVREFGIVSAFGILAALVVFGMLVPAAKVELDTLLESFGIDRRKRAFGTGGGIFSKPLTVGAIAARKAPLVVLVLAVLITASGAYGAANVDTSFDEEDFLADSPPEWTQHLPGSMAPGEYRAKADLQYVNENFQREDSQADILIEGEVTDDGTLTRLAEVEDEAGGGEVVFVLPNGDPDVESPLTVMEDVASENSTFNETFTDADTTGDGVPDRNLEGVYDELYEVDEEAASNVLYRTDDGEYEAIRIVVGVRGDAGFDETTDELRALAAIVDDDGTDDRWVATATGDPVVSHIVEQDLLATVLQSLAITLVSVFTFLTVAYWLTGKGALLGTVTLLPVAFSVSWILGTMYLLEMPFNVLTGMITSLTIGLGVAYSIHVSSRYTLELERQGNVWSALHTTVTGTGGALLGSAATTIGGFGTLAFAILPVLQQFGIITGLTIAYAFLASVVVLPSLLVLWTRYARPDVSFDSPGVNVAGPAAATAGAPADQPSPDTAPDEPTSESVDDQPTPEMDENSPTPEMDENSPTPEMDEKPQMKDETLLPEPSEERPETNEERPAPEASGGEEDD